MARKRMHIPGRLRETKGSLHCLLLQAMALFVSCSRGLEHALAKEISHLGYPARHGFRGVHVDVGSPSARMRGRLYVPSSFIFSQLQPAIYRLNYLSRIGTRVLVPIGPQLAVRSPSDLYRAVQTINWSRYLSLAKTFAIDARVSDNHQYGSRLLYSLSLF